MSLITIQALHTVFRIPEPTSSGERDWEWQMSPSVMADPGAQ